jgi:uroporphyrinogen decarboxylase
VLDAVVQVRKALGGSVPLIGFSGSPFTLACYMVEGRGGTDFALLKTMLYKRPELLHQILAVNARAVTAYLNAQIEHGAQAVMLFDTWGGLLSHRAFREFSLAYINEVVAGLRKAHEGEAVPSIVFTKGGGLWLQAIAECGCDALGVDWTVDLARARSQVGAHMALQGNMDPLVLMSSPGSIRDEAARVLAEYGNGPGHVFNLGHGVSQHTPPEHVRALIDAVHELSRPYHL